MRRSWIPRSIRPSTLLLALAVARPGAAIAQIVGVGEVEFSNSGAPEAQAAFLRGLALLHSFEYDAAAQAFRQAQETDPAFAMAYWGEAMTYNHPVWMEQDLQAAREVLDRLGPTTQARFAAAPTDREREYLATIEILYGSGSKEQRDRAYAEAMRRLHEAYPDDPDVATFYALSLLGAAHRGRDFTTYMKAAAVAEEVFRDHPNHPGAVHYLIHSYDDAIHAPLGLRAARAYSAIAPEAAHAQHMTSHIFVALGLWDEVVEANETAVAVMNAALESRGRAPRYCGHYNFWLVYGYLQQSRAADAKARLAACREAVLRAGERVRRPLSDPLDPDNSGAYSFVRMRARYIIDAEAWDDEVLDWDVPVGDVAFAPRLTYAFTTGLAAARRRDASAAREELRSVRASRERLAADLEERQTADRSRLTRARVLEIQLEGAIQAAEERWGRAIELLREAAALEETIPLRFGPPFVDKPPYELLGEVLLEAGRAREAADAFETALARTPRRTLSMLGLAEALRAAD